MLKLFVAELQTPKTKDNKNGREVFKIGNDVGFFIFHDKFNRYMFMPQKKEGKTICFDHDMLAEIAERLREVNSEFINS